MTVFLISDWPAIVTDISSPILDSRIAKVYIRCGVSWLFSRSLINTKKERPDVPNKKPCPRNDNRLLDYFS